MERTLVIKLWGSRGSLPRATTEQAFLKVFDALYTAAVKAKLTSIDEFKQAVHDRRLSSPIHFGGNTICTEITVDHSRSIFIDMGTGLTDAACSAAHQKTTEFTIFQTHMHWDHVMGLPFVPQFYNPACKFTIYHVHKNTPEHVKILFNGVNFPVKWEQLGAKIEFRIVKLYETVKIEGLAVTPFALDHPGGSFGYRVEHDGKSMVQGVDGEYKRVTQKELGKDLIYYQNLDLLIFDAQYELGELIVKYDWGHCTPTIGIDLALREGIRNLVFVHHDPRATDEKSHKMFQHAQTYCKSHLKEYKKLWQKLGQPQGPNLYAGYDGFSIKL